MASIAEARVQTAPWNTPESQDTHYRSPRVNDSARSAANAAIHPDLNPVQQDVL